MIIDKETYEQKSTELSGVEYKAWQAFNHLNNIRPIYKELSGAKLVFESSVFYNSVFKVTEGDLSGISKKARYVELRVWRGEVDGIDDHPFTTRVAFRGLFDNPNILDDFDKFLDAFIWLCSSILKISSKDNQRVKVKSDRKGNIIVPKIITERYQYEDGTPMVFIDTKTGDTIRKFPIPIKPWYLDCEKQFLVN